MKIAVIGSGIAGNVVAYRLRERHDITVFEAAGHVGGHSNTIDVFEDGRRIPIDTGFIVFNDKTYPNFIGLLDEIGQSSLASEMGFSVRALDGAIEYAGGSLDALFAQRRNLLRPSFHRMIRDILRFNREAPSARLDSDRCLTVGDYLQQHAYSEAFTEHYLVPMAAAIWSAEPQSVLDMPFEFLLGFFANHGLLQLRDRPIWRVIEGGSREYVRKLTSGHADRIRLNTPVRSLRRIDDRVEIRSDHGTEWFDYVFLACHSDQALRLLDDPTPDESVVLGAMPYQANEAILHTDTALMPKRQKAWAAWNYHLPQSRREQVAVTYNMNILQRLSARQQYCVTLNNDEQIIPSKIIRRIQYQHPIISPQSVAAQSRQADVNCDRTFYCGAYWRNGFHEDGVVSALNALRHFEERLEDAKLYLRRAS
ncbi:MAG: FAD-dependent oxidoreductase [Gammaproteobacteria bacterium]|nr:FAD-dependent oxidoreductase [Gammaproteobacteria bacterium]